MKESTPYLSFARSISARCTSPRPWEDLYIGRRPKHTCFPILKGRSSGSLLHLVSPAKRLSSGTNGHALEGSSDTFRPDGTPSTQTGHRKRAAAAQKVAATSRPSVARHDPRTTVAAAAVLSQHMSTGRPGANAHARVSPRSSANSSSSKIPAPASRNHLGACVCAVWRFLSTKHTAPRCPAPQASVYTTTGACCVVDTCRHSFDSSIAIHRGVTSLNAGESAVRVWARAAYCLSVKGWSRARPARPNRRVWKCPNLPRRLAAAAGPSVPSESACFRSESNASRFRSGWLASTLPLRGSKGMPLGAFLMSFFLLSSFFFLLSFCWDLVRVLFRIKRAFPF